MLESLVRVKKIVSARDSSLEVAKRLWIGYFQDVRTGVRRIRDRIVRSLAVVCLPLIVIYISGCPQDFRVQRVKAVPTMARSDSAGKPPTQTQERSPRIPREGKGDANAGLQLGGSGSPPPGAAEQWIDAYCNILVSNHTALTIKNHLRPGSSLYSLKLRGSLSLRNQRPVMRSLGVRLHSIVGDRGYGGPPEQSSDGWSLTKVRISPRPKASEWCPPATLVCSNARKCRPN